MNVFNKIKIIVAGSLLLSAITAHGLDAPAAMVPSGLHPGDDFFIIFVTSTKLYAASTVIGFYNSYVDNVAANSGDMRTNNAAIDWNIVGGTTTDNQCNPFDGETNVPLYNMAGQLVAADRSAAGNANLSPLANRIMLNEVGAVTSERVWTGCENDLTTKSSAPLGGGMIYGTIRTQFGDSSLTDMSWMGAGLTDPIYAYAFYAVSPKLTVAYPVSANTQHQGW